MTHHLPTTIKTLVGKKIECISYPNAYTVRLHCLDKPDSLDFPTSGFDIQVLGGVTGLSAFYDYEMDTADCDGVIRDIVEDLSIVKWASYQDDVAFEQFVDNASKLDIDVLQALKYLHGKVGYSEMIMWDEEGVCGCTGEGDGMSPYRTPFDLSKPETIEGLTFDDIIIYTTKGSITLKACCVSNGYYYTRTKYNLW